jgi:filamentous hemagglutinin family protein
MKIIVLGVLMSGAIALPTQAQNLVVPDATLGNEGSIVEPRPGFDAIKGGATRGTGLFHSFSEFGVGDRGSVQFVARPEIQNIFARVTGENVSNILGAIGTGVEKGDGSLGGTTASLFLLNPNGIVFGPNAKLDLAGSFLATTASSFKFGEGREFSAINPQAAPLLTVSAPIGLQFGQKIGSIDLLGANLAMSTIGPSLGMIGGDINIINGKVEAFAGPLDIGAVGEGERVGLVPMGLGWKADYTGVKLFKDIQIKQANLSLIAVNNTQGTENISADIHLQGQRISINERSSLFYSSSEISNPNRPIGKIRLDASQAIAIDNSRLFANSDGSTATPDISITTGILSVVSGGWIVTRQVGEGLGGNIAIDAREQVVVSQGAPSNRFTSISTFNDSQGGRSGGNIKVLSPKLSVSDGGDVGTLLVGQGKAGDIELKVDSLVVSGEARLPSQLSSGVSLDSRGGDSGNVTITARTIDAIDGGTISSNNSRSGTTGEIVINATDRVRVSGFAAYGISSRIYTNNSTRSPQVSSFQKKAPGIKINTKELLIENGGDIETQMLSDGNARDIELNVDQLTVRGISPLLSIGDDGIGFYGTSGIASSKLNGVGNGGDIRIRARSVKVLEGGSINSDISTSDASSLGYPRTPEKVFQGRAGNISIEASDLVLVEGNSPRPIQQNTTIYGTSQISSNVSVSGNGQGGNITIKTGNLQVRSGGEIQSDIYGRGQAGEVEIIAGDVSVVGVGRDKFASQISSTAHIKTPGNAGTVRLQAGSLNLLDGGAIAAQTGGPGNAGNIIINVQGDINLRGDPAISTATGILSRSVALRGKRLEDYINLGLQLGYIPVIPAEDDLGSSGNIQINGGRLSISNGAVISAISEGKGVAGDVVINLRDNLIANNSDIKTSSDKTVGGNIDLTAQAIVLRNNANIKTNVASGSGQGGNIKLTADGIVLLDDSDLLAFAQDGKGGNISLFTQALLTRTYKPSDPASNLETLDTNGFVDINATGRTSGIITLPELNPLQNSRPEIAPTLIDTDQVLSRSCLTRNPKTGKFIITGAGGIPSNPGDPPLSNYSTLPVGAETSMAEAEGLYPLDNGQLIAGKTCQSLGGKP